MRSLFLMLLLCSAIFSNCSSSHGITNIQPKSGTIEISAKGEFKIWKDIKHGSFTAMLSNASPNQSVELYKVNSEGNEKWIRPSLLANRRQEVTIPADGHLFIKNFNANAFTITYKIAD